MSERLTTAEMTRFVARGFLVFESVVPDEINAAAIELFEQTGIADMARAKPDSGTPLVTRVAIGADGRGVGCRSGSRDGWWRTGRRGLATIGTLACVAYDEGLAERIRSATAGTDGLGERKMFGGLAFMFHGNMAFGVIGDELMVRVGPDVWSDAVARPHAREMDFTGRSMKGMVYVAVDGFAEDEDLDGWLDRGLAFAGSLPPK